jgi:hypothetical protein
MTHYHSRHIYGQPSIGEVLGAAFGLFFFGLIAITYFAIFGAPEGYRCPPSLWD